MAEYQVIFHQRIDNYAVIQTLTQPDVGIGESFTLAGLGHGLNGDHVVYSLPEYYFRGVTLKAICFLTTVCRYLTRCCFTMSQTLLNVAPLFHKEP